MFFSFVVILINTGLRTHGGDLAIGAYGIANRITFIFVMIVMGICQGMQPIAGYNYGARQFDRVTEVLKKAIIFSTIVMTIGFAVCVFTPTPIVSLFTSDPELTAISANALRIINCLFMCVGVGMVTGNFFQSIGKAKISIFLSTTRQLLFLVPLLLVLPHYFGTTGVWVTIPASDLLSSVVAVVMLRHFYKHEGFKQEIRL